MRAHFLEQEDEMDWQMRAMQAEQAKNEMATALFVCAVVAGWAIGGWWGFGVFLIFALIGSSR